MVSRYARRAVNRPYCVASANVFPPFGDVAAAALPAAVDPPVAALPVAEPAPEASAVDLWRSIALRRGRRDRRERRWVWER
jgi:hypothetical protein